MPAEFVEFLGSMPRHAPVEMLAHSPKMAGSFLRTAQLQFAGMELSLRYRELLILTVAALVECGHEDLQHVSTSEAAEVDPALRESVWSGVSRRCLAARRGRPRAGRLRYRCGPLLPGPDDRLAELRAGSSDRQIVETTQPVGLYWSLGRLCTVLGLEVDTVDGVASVNAVAKLGGAG